MYHMGTLINCCCCRLAMGSESLALLIEGYNQRGAWNEALSLNINLLYSLFVS